MFQKVITWPLLVLAVAGLWGAPPAQKPDDPKLTNPPRTGISLSQRQLGLQDAVQMALENNLDIEIERTNRDSSAQAVKAARGFFDPTFRWMPLFEDRNTPTASVLQGASGKLNERFLNQNFYVRQKLPSNGLALNLDFENQRQQTSNPFNSFTPLLGSRLTVGFTQPLFRGRETDRERAELKIRRKQSQMADVDFQVRVIDVVTRVEQAYWDLVAARQDVGVKQESVRLAQEQLALNERQIRSGTLAPVELAAAEAELQRRMDSLYTAIGVVTETENALKTLIAPERQSSLWGDEILPTDSQTRETPATDDLRAAVTEAIKNRPELKGIDLRMQANQVEKQLNSDLRKPAVNLVGQYSLNGLGGTLRPGDNPFTAANTALYAKVNELAGKSGIPPLPLASLGATPDFLIGGYGTSLSNLFGGRYQSFQAGVQMDLTFRNRTAEANYAQSAIAEKRIKLEQARAEQLIEAQVRNAIQGIETARQRIAAAEASEKAAREKLASETRLFQTGESTNFLVLTRQNEASDSRRRVVGAKLELNKSISRLEQALGTTLRAHKVTVQ